MQMLKIDIYIFTQNQYILKYMDITLYSLYKIYAMYK